ncbi:hypothetical protein Tco_0597814 [Tanacetum coccineum]
MKNQFDVILDWGLEEECEYTEEDDDDENIKWVDIDEEEEKNDDDDEKSIDLEKTNDEESDDEFMHSEEYVQDDDEETDDETVHGDELVNDDEEEEMKNAKDADTRNSDKEIIWMRRVHYGLVIDAKQEFAQEVNGEGGGWETGSGGWKGDGGCGLAPAGMGEGCGGVGWSGELRVIQQGDLSVDAYFHKSESIFTLLNNLGLPMSDDDVVTYAQGTSANVSGQGSVQNRRTIPSLVSQSVSNKNTRTLTSHGIGTNFSIGIKTNAINIDGYQ